MYGYGYPSPYATPYAAAAAPAAPAYPLANYQSNLPMGYAFFGAEGDPSYTDRAKTWLDEPTGGVAHKWWLLGAAVIGGIWYANSQRWI